MSRDTMAYGQRNQENERNKEMPSPGKEKALVRRHSHEKNRDGIIIKRLTRKLQEPRGVVVSTSRL